MAERIVSFVMSGGVGSRLWPLSREDNPKARPKGEMLPPIGSTKPHSPTRWPFA